MAIRVLVELYTTLPEKLGWRKKWVELPDNATLRDLFDAVEGLEEARREYLEKGWDLIILVDGRHHKFTGGMDTRLYDGATVSVFPPSAGG